MPQRKNHSHANPCYRSRQSAFEGRGVGLLRLHLNRRFGLTCPGDQGDDKTNPTGDRKPGDGLLPVLGDSVNIRGYNNSHTANRNRSFP